MKQTKKRLSILSVLLVIAMIATLFVGCAPEEDSSSIESTATPETSGTPDTTGAPETTAPETTAPETTAPETTAPETTAPQENEEPEEPALADGTYIIFNGDKAMKTLATDATYGYAPSDNKNDYSYDSVWTITNVTGGVTIQDSYGRYIYSSGTYQTLSISDSEPAEGHVWTVVKNDDETYTITNAVGDKTLAYDTGYGSWGIYLPANVKDTTVTKISATAASVTWTAVGDFQSYNKDAGKAMVATDVEHVFRTEQAVALTAKQSVKVIGNGGWTIQYGAPNGVEALWAELAGNYYIQFNALTRELSLIPADKATADQAKVWTVVGSMNSWDEDGGETMVKTEDPDVYKTTRSYDLDTDSTFKIVLNGSWNNANYGSDYKGDGGNNCTVTEAGKYFITFNVRTKEVGLKESAGVKYTKVTAAPEEGSDWAGKYLIVLEKSETEGWAFASTDKNGYTVVEITDGAIANSDNVASVVIELEKHGEHYAIKMGDKYLKGKSGKTYLDKADWADDDNTLLYDVSLVDGKLSIVQVMDSERSLMVTKSSDFYFRFYKTGSNYTNDGLALYKQEFAWEDGTYESPLGNPVTPSTPSEPEPEGTKYATAYDEVIWWDQANQKLAYQNSEGVYTNISYTTETGVNGNYYKFKDPSFLEKDYYITFCEDDAKLFVDSYGGDPTDYATYTTEYNLARSLSDEEKGTYTGTVDEDSIKLEVGVDGDMNAYITVGSGNRETLGLTWNADESCYTYEEPSTYNIVRVYFSGDTVTLKKYNNESNDWEVYATLTKQAVEVTTVFTGETTGTWEVSKLDAAGETIVYSYSIKINSDGKFDFFNGSSWQNNLQLVEHCGCYSFTAGENDYWFVISGDGQNITLMTADSAPIVLTITGDVRN